MRDADFRHTDPATLAGSPRAGAGFGFALMSQMLDTCRAAWESRAPVQTKNSDF